MTATEWSYLAVWFTLAAVLLVSGGLGVVLAPFAAFCGIHRSHALQVVRRRRYATT